jgi:hypothetical protein
MPDVLAPEDAVSMELRLTDAVAFVVLDKSELIAEVELMASTYIPGRRHRYTPTL